MRAWAKKKRRWKKQHGRGGTDMTRGLETTGLGVISIWWAGSSSCPIWAEVWVIKTAYKGSCAVATNNGGGRCGGGMPGQTGHRTLRSVQSGSCKHMGGVL